MSGSADFFGMPEYFIQDVRCEDAGHGNMRVYLSSKRGNELVPQCTVVMSISEMAEAAATVKQRAAEIWNDMTLKAPELVN